MARRWQRGCGAVGSILLAVALLGLVDGLIAQMRQGPDELALLPGQSLAISGPTALKNPLNGDVRAVFTPADPPLTFDLEGFFTGYWFGSGMWRGKIAALPDAAGGEYELRISFRGASARSAQTWKISVYENAEAMRQASKSLLMRLAGVNPFAVAVIGGGLGIFSGIVTYICGRRFARALANLGFAEIYRVDPAGGALWCLAPKGRSPAAGAMLAVFAPDGAGIGTARVVGWHKGRLRLAMAAGSIPGEGALLCLVPEKYISENNSSREA